MELVTGDGIAAAIDWGHGFACVNVKEGVDTHVEWNTMTPEELLEVEELWHQFVALQKRCESFAKRLAQRQT